MRKTLFILFFLPIICLGQYSNYYYSKKNIEGNVNVSKSVDVSGSVNHYISKQIDVSGNVNHHISKIDYGQLAAAEAKKERTRLIRNIYANEEEKIIYEKIAEDPVNAYEYGETSFVSFISKTKKEARYVVFQMPHKSLFNKLTQSTLQNVDASGNIKTQISFHPSHGFHPDLLRSIKLVDYQELLDFAIKWEKVKQYEDSARSALKSLFLNKTDKIVDAKCFEDYFRKSMESIKESGELERKHLASHWVGFEPTVKYIYREYSPWYASKARRKRESLHNSFADSVNRILWSQKDTFEKEIDLLWFNLNLLDSKIKNYCLDSLNISYSDYRLHRSNNSYPRDLYAESEAKLPWIEAGHVYPNELIFLDTRHRSDEILTDSSYIHYKDVNRTKIAGSDGFKGTIITEDSYEKSIEDSYIISDKSLTVNVKYYGDKDDVKFEDLEGRRRYLEDLIYKVISLISIHDSEINE